MSIDIVIIGSGGHAKEVINVLRANNEFNLVGCTTLQPDIKSILDIPILGDDSILPQLWRNGVKHAFIAVGDNHIRAHLYQTIKNQGFRYVNAISAFSHFMHPTTLGENVLIMPGAIISVDAKIGSNTIIGPHCYIAHDCLIDQHAHVAAHSSLLGHVTVNAGAFIGAGCRVLPHNLIGEWSIIGAGAVVTKTIPARVTAMGIPAKICAN